MVNLETKARQCLKEFDLRTLFIEEMGWDHHVSSLEVFVDGSTYNIRAVAQKRGMIVFLCSPANGGSIPDYSTRRKIEKQVAKSVHEHLIIYTDKDHKFQIWQWVKREAGKPTQCREHRYYCNQPGDSLLQKLDAIAFSLDEEEGLTIVDVASRVRAGFDIDRVTKKFYDRFKSEHDTFLRFLKGIPDEEMQRWYVSVMLNRLMFIYFIQKKGFLDNNTDYLRDKLTGSKQRGGDRFYKDFLCSLFFEGFAKKGNERNPSINKLLGKVPFLNGGIFQPHQLEELYGKSIQIGDAAFEKLFSFFDQYQWHLDERPLRADNEINPDVLGYIFEKYVNQKQMGAYYTKEDITGYISKNTVIPYIFDEVRKKCKIAFENEQSVWCLLQADPDRYIYDAVKKGVNSPFPLEIAVGLNDFSKRTEWNKLATEEYALPTETWREVVMRHKHYEEVRAKLANGEIKDINDLITYNLNIRQFAQDVIETCEGPELLRAFWHTIEEVTILDPACGSGAFLFAALNILEPLYEACLERMEIFLDELEHSGEKNRPEKFIDFRKVLSRIDQHPNRRYFIFKSIIVNNLYGVDIMDEAVEICKLRLFLKLVAQVERVENIEPLPDIDFNIRAGNTLVGYATYEEVKRAILGETQGKFDLGKDMQRIDEKAQDVNRMFGLFRQQQTELGGEVTPSDKQELRKRLKALEDELNRYLAGEYGVAPDKKANYEKWRTSHKAFHWFIDFYGIVHKQGGFDVIIGNPPYVEYSKIRKDYTVKNINCLDSGNLYAYIIERSLHLQHTSSRVGMIIQLSAFCTPRMKSFQDTLFKKINLAQLAFFDDRPGKLFEGLEHIRVAILLGHVGSGKPVIATTRYIKFPTEVRPTLFETIYMQTNAQPRHGSSIFKISTPIENEIVRKLWSTKYRLAHYLEEIKNENFVYYGYGFGYWGKILNFKSYFRGEKVTASTGDKYIYCCRDLDRDIVVATMNSSLFYWFYVNFSDGHNFTKHVIGSFPFSSPNPKVIERLKNLCSKLMVDLKSHANRRKAFYEATGNVEYDEFVPKLSKPIIDEIDCVLAQDYCFTDEELDFVINYDIKYRMGTDSVEEVQ